MFLGYDIYIHTTSPSSIDNGYGGDRLFSKRCMVIVSVFSSSRPLAYTQDFSPPFLLPITEESRLGGVMIFLPVNLMSFPGININRKPCICFLLFCKYRHNFNNMQIFPKFISVHVTKICTAMVFMVLAAVATACFKVCHKSYPFMAQKLSFHGAKAILSCCDLIAFMTQKDSFRKVLPAHLHF